MASLADLLRYKDEIEIIHPKTGKPVKKVWVRVLGDLDLTNAYKAARLASAAKRAALRDPSTDDYKDEVLGVADISDDEKKDLIKTARLTNIVSEATVSVIRPDLPKIEEIAVDPDAPSLEELEELDKAEKETEEDYSKKIDEYINARTAEVEAELDAMTSEELTKEAQKEVSTIVPFSLFVTELNAQKAFYGTYQDKECKKREFETIEEFRQLPSETQQAIIFAINRLEVDGPTIKN